MGEETSGHTDGREDMKSDVSKLQILVASNALYNAQLIKDLLYREFHKVAVSTCAELSIPDFEEYGSQVLARSEEHTSELQSLMRISYAVFCLKKKKIRLIITQRYNDIHYIYI